MIGPAVTVHVAAPKPRHRPVAVRDSVEDGALTSVAAVRQQQISDVPFRPETVGASVHEVDPTRVVSVRAVRMRRTDDDVIDAVVVHVACVAHGGTGVVAVGDSVQHGAEAAVASAGHEQIGHAEDGREPAVAPEQQIDGT